VSIKALSDQNRSETVTDPSRRSATSSLCEDVFAAAVWSDVAFVSMTEFVLAAAAGTAVFVVTAAAGTAVFVYKQNNKRTTLCPHLLCVS